jgi:hypothetical protein
LGDRFHGGILAIDILVAEPWGRLMARESSSGRTVDPLDGFIAATAGTHELTLVTRNVARFRAPGVELLV